MKREGQLDTCMLLSYNQKGGMLQYLICNKNTIKVWKMPFSLRAEQGLSYFSPFEP